MINSSQYIFKSRTSVQPKLNYAIQGQNIKYTYLQQTNINYGSNIQAMKKLRHISAINIA